MQWRPDPLGRQSAVKNRTGPCIILKLVTSMRADDQDAKGSRAMRRGFTLIELLIVVAIMSWTSDPQ